MHLNASDERGIDVVRKPYTIFIYRYDVSQEFTINKLIILDEADSMDSNAASVARYNGELRNIVCFIGNYQYTFIPQLQSRLIKLLFTPIPEEDAIELQKPFYRKNNLIVQALIFQPFTKHPMEICANF